ncbi:MAG: hypothetical protein K2I24_06605 [Duncaniella sp.]|nr:hypothetical protein [Duncaniella sp.]
MRHRDIHIVTPLHIGASVIPVGYRRVRPENRRHKPRHGRAFRLTARAASRFGQLAAVYHHIIHLPDL